MLTRSQKKRNTDCKDNIRCPQNSKQKSHSSISSKRIAEVGEMVTMEHGSRPVSLASFQPPRSNPGGTSGGLLHDDCHQRMDYPHMAWLLREKLNDIVDGDDIKGELNPGLGLQSLLDMAALRHIVSVDPKALNPILWRMLPKELLLLVFAHLPVPDTIRLQSLSKEWRRDMTTLNSDIKQACDEASPIIMGISYSRVFDLNQGFYLTLFLVTICDLRSTQLVQFNSYNFHDDLEMNADPILRGRWDTMGALDGGLACYVSTWRPSKAYPLCIVVINPLTRVHRILPPLQYAYSTPPQMMHIQVDSKTKCYRVVVVGKNIRGHPTVELYDSSARQWTKATTPRLGCIFGLTFDWVYKRDYNSFLAESPIQCVYDFGERQLKLCESGMYPSREVAAVWNFSKFVLHKNTSNGEILQAEGGHYIIEYRIQNNAKDWVQERSYLCSPFEDHLKEFGLSKWELKACKGFLMLFPLFYRICGHFWLLDLSTGEWNRHASCFEGNRHHITMCRAFWNVVP